MRNLELFEAMHQYGRILIGKIRKGIFINSLDGQSCFIGCNKA